MHNAFADMWVWNEFFFPSPDLIMAATQKKVDLHLPIKAFVRKPKLLCRWDTYSYGVRRVLARDIEWRKDLVGRRPVPHDPYPIPYPVTYGMTIPSDSDAAKYFKLKSKLLEQLLWNRTMYDDK